MRVTVCTCRVCMSPSHRRHQFSGLLWLLRREGFRDAEVELHEAQQGNRGPSVSTTAVVMLALQ